MYHIIQMIILIIHNQKIMTVIDLYWCKNNDDSYKISRNFQKFVSGSCPLIPNQIAMLNKTWKENALLDSLSKGVTIQCSSLRHRESENLCFSILNLLTSAFRKARCPLFSELASGSCGPVSSPGGEGDIILLSWKRHFTFTVPLFPRLWLEWIP